MTIRADSFRRLSKNRQSPCTEGASRGPVLTEVVGLLHVSEFDSLSQRILFSLLQPIQ